MPIILSGIQGRRGLNTKTKKFVFRERIGCKVRRLDILPGVFSRDMEWKIKFYGVIN